MRAAPGGRTSTSSSSECPTGEVVESRCRTEVDIKKIVAPEAKLELYRRLLQSVPEVDAKSNFGSAYTAINGNMYTIISKHGVVGIRLPEPEHSEFLDTYATELFRGGPAWPPTKEFVAVPDDLLEDTKTQAVSRAESRLCQDSEAQADEEVRSQCETRR